LEVTGPRTCPDLGEPPSNAISKSSISLVSSLSNSLSKTNSPYFRPLPFDFTFSLKLSFC
uniref:Uncharacterized protein n=1 Tax=Stegastes partitus TaxID=144197 RepID=A0A3B4Z7K9_9TELE